MNKENRQTLVWDNIPEWAIFSLEYGIDEELFLPDEDKEMITKFIVENFPNGYTMSVELGVIQRIRHQSGIRKGVQDL